MNARITGIRVLRRTVVLLGPILLGAGLAFGAGQDGPDAALASRIGKAKVIRVVTPFGKRTIWKPVLSADGIGSVAAQTVQVPWPQALQVQVRKRGTRAGLWIGSGVFAGLGGAASAVVASLGGDEEVGFGEVAAGALIGGALGAGLGAAVGSLFIRWKTVYEAPSKAAPVARLSLAPGRRGGVSIALAVAF
jgi:hypothetical protein